MQVSPVDRCPPLPLRTTHLPPDLARIWHATSPGEAAAEAVWSVAGGDRIRTPRCVELSLAAPNEGVVRRGQGQQAFAELEAAGGAGWSSAVLNGVEASTSPAPADCYQ